MYKPITEKPEHKQLIADIKQYVANDQNWNYDRPNEKYTTYKLENSQELYYFGTYHITETDDPLINVLSKEFKDFTTKHKEKIVILIEDWLLQKYENQIEAIEKRGERGLLMYLGEKANMQVIPIDYDRHEIYTILENTYDAELTDLFAFLYLVKTRLDKKELTIENYIEKANEYIKNSFEFIKRENSKYTFMYFANLYEKIIQRNLLKDIKVSTYEIIYPSKSKHEIAQLFKTYHSIRDENFLYQICANYLEGKNIFAVLGQDHALFAKEFLTHFVISN